MNSTTGRESLVRQEGQPVPKRTLAFIFLVTLLDVIGVSILFPVSAFIVREYSASALSVTLLTVIYSAAQFLAAPYLGRLSDRYGRRPILLVCVAGSAAGYFMFGVGGALWVLFLSRLIDGITGGNLSVVNAFIADVTPPENRAKSFALIGAAFGTGFVLGPALGGALSQVSLAAPAYVAGLLSLVNLAFGFFVLPESLPAEQRETRPLTLADANPLASILEMARRPTLGMLLLVQALFFFAFDGMNAVLSVFAIDKFAASPAALAVVFTISGIGNIVVQGFLVGRLVSRFGEKLLASISLLFQAVMFLVIFLVPDFWMLYPVAALSTAVTGLIWPTMGALVANTVPQREQGRVSGVSTSVGALMTALGPLWAGLIYDRLGPGAPFWSGAVILLAALVLLRGIQPVMAEAPQPSQSA